MPVLAPAARATARTVTRTAAPLGVLALAVAAFAYVGAVDPHQAGHYPACPLLAVTGLHCPGCGGLRSAHAVAHGDLVGALRANAVAVAGYAVAAGLLARWLLRSLRGERAPATARPRRAGPRAAPGAAAPPRGRLWALAAGLIVFTVLRNLPAGAFLVP